MALQTATNPETGEKVILVGDQWLPISQTATNDKGQKAYLANNQWITEPVAAPKPEPTFMQRAGTAFGRGLEAVPESGTGISFGIKSALGMTPQASATAEQIRQEGAADKGAPAISFEELQKTYSDKGLLEALKKAPAYVTEQVLQSAPSMAVPLAAAAAATPFTSPIGGAIAGIGTYGVQQFGNFMRRQAEEGATGETAAPGKAAATAAVTAPIGYFADRLMLGFGKVPEKILGQQVAAELAKRAGVRAATGATIGVVAEAPTEVLEQMGERWQAGLSLTGEEAMREYKEAFFGAAAVGGVGGAAAGAIRKPTVVPKEEPTPYEPPVSLTGKTPADMFQEQIAGRQGLGEELTTAAREREAAAAEEKAAKDEAIAAEQAAAQERTAGMFAGQGPQAGADLISAARERSDEQEKIAEADRVAKEAERVAEESATRKALNDAAQAILKTQLSPSPELNVIQQNKALEAMGYTASVDEKGNLIAIPKPRDLMMARVENEQKIVEGRRAEEMRTTMGGAEANADLLAAARERQVQPKDMDVTSEVTPEAEPIAGLTLPKEEEAPPFIEATPIEGEPAPQLEEVTDLQKDLDKAEKERRRFTQGKSKGLSLWTAVRGKLTPEEVNDIGPGLMFKSLQKKGGKGGTDMSSLVADGKLDDFLPPRMRPASEFHDEQESVEYIKEKLRRNNYYTFDTNMAIQNVDNTVEQLERAIRELLTLEEINLEIQRATDEQATIDREAQEAPAPSETGVTEERQGKDATAAEVIGAKETVEEEASQVKNKTTREKLKEVADNLGISVFETSDNFKSSTDGYVNIPPEDKMIEGVTPPDHIFAHELGHAIMQKRGMSFGRMPQEQVKKWIPNFDKLKEISRAFRPEMHKHKLPKFRRHSQKPDEIIADALGSFLLDKTTRAEMQPMFDGLGLTDYDLGLAKFDRRSYEDKLIADAEKDAQERAEKRAKRDAELEAQAKGTELTSPTPAEIIAKQDAAIRAERERKDAERAKEEKAKADEARADFTLTGSEREADVAAARGQKDIFTTSAKAKPPELDTTDFKPSKGRHPQVQAAGRRFQEGTMSREEFTKYVDYYTPITDVDIQKLQAPSTTEQMKEALPNGGSGKINTPIKAGERVGLRMDIKARNKGTNVVSIHKGAENISKKTNKPLKDAGKVISYASVARIKDVFFAPRDQEKSLDMGINPTKEPLQTAEGVWVPTTPEEAFAEVKRLGNDPAWTQVNFNPAQRGYFYDRVTGEPVVTASELIQIGNFILAKDVEYAPKEEFLYSAEGSTLGFNNTKENLEIAEQIKGKTLVEVSKWAIDNAPNPVAKYFAQKVYDRIKQMEAKGVRFGFDILTGATRPNTPVLPMKNARGVASFIWGDKSKGEDTTIRIILNGPTVFKNQDGYPPGVEYRTILHELLHVATRGQLHFLQASDPLVKEIRLLFNQVIAHYQKDFKNGTLSGIAKDYYDRKNNAFKNDDELVSWGITDERMQKYMSGIKVGEGTVFSKLINLIRKVLGVAPPYESALDRLVRTTDELLSVDIEEISEGIERQGYSFGPGRKKATTGVQQSLFSKKVQELFANKEGSTSSVGQDALNLMAQIGRTTEKPNESYIAKVRQSWDNVKDNPKATAEAASSAVTKFLDQVQTWAFSSDAGLNNSIRRAVMDSTMDSKDKIGTLLSTSLSQTAHADAVASLFITQGNVVYDKDLYKWKGVKDEANFVELSRQLDAVAEKYGLTKEQAELIGHTAFEAKRLKSMVEFNNQVDIEVAKMRAEAASIRADKPVAASTLSDRASKRLQDKKFIHMSDDQIAAGMSLFDSMPELKGAVKTWNAIRENTVDKLVGSGLWSEEEAEFMLDNADYVPFFREEQLEEGKGPKEYIRGLMVQAKEKKLKGSDRPVNDIFDNMIRWTQYSINRAVRNQSALSLIDAATDAGLAKKVDSRSAGDNVVRVWREGKEEFHDMTDPMFVQAFTGLEAIAIPSWKWAAKLSNMLRQSVVMYPLFSVSQVPQDAFAAMFSSGLNPRFALTIPARAAKEFALTLFNRSKTQEELKQYGVVGVRDFTSAMVRMDAEIYAGFKAQPGVLNKIKNGLSHIAMASDNAVRQAVYEASMAQGLSKAEALEKSFEIWNVRRKGSSKTLALAGQVIPFFNAYLAAQNVAYKTITGVGSSPTERDAAFKTLIATTGSVMALSLIYAMMNGDDEDYENKPAIVRDRLLMIPGTGGLSIPLRADLFTLPKVVTEHMYLLITDKGYEDGRKFRDSIKNILGSALLSPTAVPQAIKPLVEVGINYNFFTGRPLIGEFEKKKETARQFTDSTSELAKWLGSSGLVSPIAADHLVRGMFGSAGGLVIYMTNPLMHNDPNVDRPSMSWRQAAATLPGTSGFISREYESGLKNDFYVLRDEVSKVANTMADLKARSPEKIEEYLSREEIATRYGMSKAVAKMTEQLGNIRKSISRITNMPKDQMSAGEKEEAIKELRNAEREMLKGINVKELRAMAKV